MEHKPLHQPQSGLLTVQYEPNETTVLVENPPRFTWIAARPEHERYMLQWSTSAEFDPGQTHTVAPVSYNFYTPDHALDPGAYYWRYAELAEGSPDSPSRSEWSETRQFQVPRGLPHTPLPSRSVRYANIASTHPRLWLPLERHAAFREAIHHDPAHWGWDVFYEKSVQPWLKREPTREPQPYPNNKRVANLWRQMYIDCQELLYGVRHLAIAGVLLEEEELIASAKRWLLHAASWNPEGSTSRDYNDEAAFRVAGALAWGYDWLCDRLSDEERAFTRRQLLVRTRQVAHHVIERSKIHHVPYDSHAVRSLSSVLVPCCIALLGEEPEAQEWLDYTIEYLYTIYSPWGGADGGWAEGPMYWTTGMAYVTEAINLLRNYTGLDVYGRPFFQKTGDFPLYCFSPDTLRASFGDQSMLGEPVSLKTGYLIRQFAGLTGNGMYQWYYEETKKRDAGNEMKFYNWGWWDFPFDDLMYRSDFPEVVPVPPQAADPLHWFQDVGWVAMHHRMDDPGEHIMLLAKSSRYGSISHSHGDQNAFLLHAFGEPLAIHSGYYLSFGSTMHTQWRRQTRSKNAILINGCGQYAGSNKALNIAASGSIMTAEKRGDCSYVRMDATAAYKEQVPDLVRYEREIYFMRGAYFVIVDSVDLTAEGNVSWLLHSLHAPSLQKDGFRVEGSKADLQVTFAYSSSGPLAQSLHKGFPGVEPSELVGLDDHYHVEAIAPHARQHRIVALLVPRRKGDGKSVSFFLDDQDHGVSLYFTDNGVTDRVELAKAC